MFVSVLVFVFVFVFVFVSVFVLVFLFVFVYVIARHTAGSVEAANLVRSIYQRQPLKPKLPREACISHGP